MIMVLRKLDQRKYKHQPHLRDLLVRLDFNGHFADEKEEEEAEEEEVEE